jgi:hypothetical protein
MEETMPEHVTGSDLRARADGLKAVVEGDERTFDRGALLGIIQSIKADLQSAANTLEAHELHRRQTEHPQHNGAGSGDPNPGGTPRDLGAAPSSAEPSSVEPAPPDAHREAAHDKPRGKDRVEK